ncbi:hypothetical protein BRADI_5g03065v3 [Brachypodium distachyon]|uniref:Uncharacterized protein n=1 Tax=Brachypodium distachyon TaxID=15368 RepID=A0A0Q3E247_BRADI|nr:hypothetical protein BRADI_5g03065v3 [Brachypodium distachyon]
MHVVVVDLAGTAIDSRRCKDEGLRRDLLGGPAIFQWPSLVPGSLLTAKSRRQCSGGWVWRGAMLGRWGECGGELVRTRQQARRTACSGAWRRARASMRRRARGGLQGARDGATAARGEQQCIGRIWDRRPRGRDLGE